MTLPEAKVVVTRLEREADRLQREYMNLAYAALDAACEEYPRAAGIRDDAEREAESARVDLWNARVRLFRLEQDVHRPYRAGARR